MGVGRGQVMGAIGFIGIVAVLSCSQSSMGPTAPVARGAKGITSADLKGATLLDQYGNLCVYRLPQHPGRVAVRFAQVAVQNPSTGQVTLLGMDEAAYRLKDTDPVTPLYVWRLVPESRAHDSALANEIPSSQAFLALLPEPHRVATLTGTDPDPPPPPPTCKCCPGVLPGTWGCLKCCYRVSDKFELP
jgi:hypothetical protein